MLPFIEATVEHNYLIVTIVVESPPQARCKLRRGMSVISNDQVLIAYTQTSHHLCETLGWRYLGLYIRIWINDIAAPIDIDCSRYVALFIFILRTYIEGILHSIMLHRTYITTHIHNAYMSIVQMLRQPGRFY